MNKRFDILVFDKAAKPWMMIECKAATIKLDDAVLQQILRYNITLPVPFIIITNGSLTYGWQRKDNNLDLITEIPGWK